MNIIFFGTSEFAIPALRALVHNGMVPIAVVTAPDKPKGRGQRLASSPINKWIQKNDLDKSGSILQPEKLDSGFMFQISNLKPDIGIVAAYGKILSKELISIFPLGILNIHPSLLPKYRGPSPIQAAILNGDTETGVTVITIDEKMDHGSIVAQQRLKEMDLVSLNQITYSELHNQLAELGSKLLIETLPEWIAGRITPMPQDDTKATYTTLLKKDDGKIDWSKSAEEIERMVRAYNPWPGSYTNIEKVGLLKIKEASTSPIPPSFVKMGVRGGGFHALPGTFFKTRDGFPAVVCGKGDSRADASLPPKNALKLLIVQSEGGKEMPGDAFIRGNPVFQ